MNLPVPSVPLDLHFTYNFVPSFNSSAFLFFLLSLEV